MIARDGRIISQGYNGAPASMPHCTHECDCGYPDSDGLLFDGVHLSNCSSIQPCTVAVHAEANAVAFAAKNGIRVEGAELHTTCTPCVNCAMLLINAGVVRVVAMDKYRDPAGEDLLTEAGIVVEGFIE